jgi:anti-sigma B factor antagonist
LTAQCSDQRGASRLRSGVRVFPRFPGGKTHSVGGRGGQEEAVNFRLRTEQLGEDAYAIAFVGEADPYSAPELKRELVEAVDRGARHIVVDLTETTFIDSTTLGVLIGGLKRLKPRGGDLSLVCADPNIRKIFEITLLDRIFTIDASLPDARERLELTPAGS